MLERMCQKEKKGQQSIIDTVFFTDFGKLNLLTVFQF